MKSEIFYWISFIIDKNQWWWMYFIHCEWTLLVLEWILFLNYVISFNGKIMDERCTFKNEPHPWTIRQFKWTVIWKILFLNEFKPFNRSFMIYVKVVGCYIQCHVLSYKHLHILLSTNTNLLKWHIPSKHWIGSRLIFH
jgi:hypothetical protein